MRRLSIVLLAAILVARFAHALTLLVPSQYPTIQSAINAAQDGDTVLVSAGIYAERIDFLGKQIVVSGAAGAMYTTIDGQYAGCVVTFSGGETRAAVLEGFTLTRGLGTAPPGNGITCRASTAPTIRNNTISQCGGVWAPPGGGIGAANASPLIEDNVIQANQCAYQGAGIYLHECSDAVVRGNEILDNFCWSGYGVAQGGGLFASNCANAAIELNLIARNEADIGHGFGGGICIYEGGNYRLVCNTLADNDADIPSYVAGGNICIDGNSRVELTGNIIINARNGGGLSYLSFFPTMPGDFNDFWNNRPMNYNGYQSGPGDISADPLFSDVQPNGYGLMADSPCINAGPYAAAPDHDGTRTDMGAYYYSQWGMNITLVPDTWPIHIPAAGGSFRYTLYLTNNTSNASVTDFWVDARLPDSTAAGPFFVRNNINFMPYSQQSRHLAQTVPASAPAGDYLLQAHAGDYASGVIEDEMFLPFSKGIGDWGLGASKLESDGEKWAVGAQRAAPLQTPLPREFALGKCYPNPFNAATTIEVSLLEAGDFELEIFDISGRKLVELASGWHLPGEYRYVWDAAGRAAGMYFMRLQAGETRLIEKVVMLK